MVNLKDGKRIWDQAKYTDPRFTKSVSKGAYRFTAVDAQYNVLRAHEIFGAHGDKWGWDLVSTDVVEGVFIVCIKLWYIEEVGMDDEGAVCEGRRECSPVFGAEGIVKIRRSGERVIDEDAPKKALTDALSKAFSYLGFSADVFLGMFDNQKYVDAMNKRFAKENAGE
jgi:hypothetical protein